MFRLRRSNPNVEFCDRCGTVCDQACRTNQMLEKARLDVLRHTGRIA